MNLIEYITHDSFDIMTFYNTLKGVDTQVNQLSGLNFTQSGKMVDYTLPTNETVKVVSVLYDESKALTYNILPTGQQTVYGVSFEFSGCGMGLFKYDSDYYIVHISSPSHGGVDGIAAWNAFLNLNSAHISKCIVFFPDGIMQKENKIAVQGGQLETWYPIGSATGIVKIDNDNITCYSFVEMENTQDSRRFIWEVEPISGCDKCKYNTDGRHNLNEKLMTFSNLLRRTGSKTGGCCEVV